MHIFTGKFTWFQYAKDESIVIAMPSVLEAGQPVWGFWQWTVDAKSVQKSNSFQHGKIKSVGAPDAAGTRAIDFAFEYYSFSGTVAAHNASLTLTMRNPAGDTDPSDAFTLAVDYADEAGAPVARAYVGKLDWFHYVQNEMVTVVLPVGFGPGAPVCMFFEWSENKSLWAANTTLREYSREEGGELKATFRGYKETGEQSWYIFNFEVTSDKQVMTLWMKNDPGSSDAKSPYKLEYVAGP